MSQLSVPDVITLRRTVTEHCDSPVYALHAQAAAALERAKCSLVERAAHKDLAHGESA